MSRHQAYRNYDYQNDMDEYDGGFSEEEEDTLSPEDRALMNAGTAEVRILLGPELEKQVALKDIEDALWHYYYDADKSVEYLKSKLQKPDKPPSKSKGNKPQEGACLCHVRSVATRGSYADFFLDMPWLSVPKEKQAIFIEPLRSKGGLLGGSGAQPKMSKLQALAAARKKKSDERRSEDKVQGTQEQLNSLSIQDKSRQIEDTQRQRQSESPTKRRRLDETSESTSSTVTSSAEPAEPVCAPIARPSALAQTLFGSALDTPDQPRTQHFSFPYLALAPSCVDDAFSEPSPDDQVLAAQAKAVNHNTPTSTPKKKGGQLDATANGVKGLRLDDTPLPKSKNLNVIGEYERSKTKKRASFVVVGHVDAGKSTLMGRLLLDLNVVDQRTIDKYRREAETMGKSSFALAWVLDQGTEERSRGVTIDIATNRFETDSTSFTILDAPGHKDFIPNMIAGASQADFAILVIDADTGAFESGLKGQTREHSLLLRSVGVSRVIVAVNKLDTINWSQDRFDEISQQVSGFLTTTGFQKKNVSFVPVSGLQGDNLVRRSENAASSWYTGPTLIEELENSEPLGRALDRPLRMTISEVYKTALSSLTVSGRIECGSLQVGDALLIQPAGEKAYIKSLQLDMEPVDWAVAGQNVVLNLSNIDAIHVKVGDIICDPVNPIDCIDTFTMKALAFDILMPMQVDVHRGRLHAAGQIQEISAVLNKSTGATIKKKPKIVKPGNVARIVVKMNSKVPLEPGQRVVLRSGGGTVAAGLLE